MRLGTVVLGNEPVIAWLRIAGRPVVSRILWHTQPANRRHCAAWAIDQANKAAAHGCPIVFRIWAWTKTTAPDMLGRAGGITNVPLAEWKAGLEKTVRAVAGKVHAWQLENEVNLGGPAAVAGYIERTRAAVAIIRRYDPGALIVLGGIATDPSRQLWAAPWLDKVVVIVGAVDVVAVHSYGPDPGAPASDASLWLDRHGLPDMPVWVTEFGHKMADPVVIAAQISLLRQRSRVAEAFVYRLADEAGNPQRFGLLNADGSPKPAWDVFASSKP